MSQDLERRISNYYQETGHQIEIIYRIRPDVETEGALYLLENNNEGDVRFVKETENYFIYDESEWHELPKLPISSDAALTKKDLEQAIQESLDDYIAAPEEIIDEILKGVASAYE